MGADVVRGLAAATAKPVQRLEVPSRAIPPRMAQRTARVGIEVLQLPVVDECAVVGADVVGGLPQSSTRAGSIQRLDVPPTRVPDVQKRVNRRVERERVHLVGVHDARRICSRSVAVGGDETITGADEQPAVTRGGSREVMGRCRQRERPHDLSGAWRQSVERAASEHGDRPDKSPCDDRRRSAAGGLIPDPVEGSGRVDVHRGDAVGTRHEDDASAYREAAEGSVAGGVAHLCAVVLAAAWVRVAGQPRLVQQIPTPALANLEEQAAGQQRRVERAQVGVARTKGRPRLGQTRSEEGLQREGR